MADLAERDELGWVEKPRYLPFLKGEALKHAVLVHNNGRVTKVATPGVDWEKIHYIDMGNDTMLGVMEGQSAVYKMTKTAVTNFSEVKRMKEHPGNERVSPGFINVNNRYAYLIAGENFTSCWRYDLQENEW